ncbi:TonB-dependent receptor [Sphingomonas sp. SFZ2018-12]|uniref:TonB-dependent receptor n=1 Tax=Sphingomonas sp. SFZ2018-12 TaxID=2683197 RepID=UPI001F0E8B5C|nr:TonB-dependent receptor [Sphingomonas sp. SFZ2018-12]MCH4894848.1 TonB-dependent receptor [Sphingomonas sp. SFZ2018-12]
MPAPATLRLSAALIVAGIAAPTVALARPGQDAVPPPPPAEAAVPTEDAAPPQVTDMDDMMSTDALETMAIDDVPPDIIVTGMRTKSRRADVASGSTLTADALARNVRATIGETLARLPGVSSASFGPGASRPTLRGFNGERARLLIDGIGSLDVSNTSPDHAVAINPIVSERIEILRGPTALLYASGSTGGVVNSVTNRIPRRLPEGIDGVVKAGFASAANERSIAAAVNVGVGSNIVLHADGQFLRSGLLETGGFILGPTQRAQALASPDPAVRALADLAGDLPSSAARTFEIAGGASIILATGQVGISFGTFESEYGLPTRFSLEPDGAVLDSRIELDQQRFDLRFEFDGPAGIETIRGRFGYADYAHDEILTDDTITATFLNTAYEGRVEAALAPIGAWQPTFGAVLYQRNFSVVGPAPLLPPNRTSQFAAFMLHSISLGEWRLEGSARYERIEVEADRDDILRNPVFDRGYDAVSFAAGVNRRFGVWNVAFNANYSQRAPVVEELLTQGIDPGTQGTLLGNTALDLERSYGGELIVRHETPIWALGGTLHYTEFSSAIFARETGEIIDNLPVFSFDQVGATFWGFELEGRVRLARFADWTLMLDGLADYNRATLADGSPFPRIPPFRALGAIGGESGTLSLRAELEYVAAQRRLSPFETPTDDYATVNLTMTWRPVPTRPELAFQLSADNLFDATGRRHASLLKDFAPIAGRDIRASVRFGF